MSDIAITVVGGTSKRLLTAGKYCESDIIVTATGDNELYTGSYEITPGTTVQTMSTANKLLINDVVIHEIPYSEVTNLTGGMTATIG